jgi:hypothetical protein
MSHTLTVAAVCDYCKECLQAAASRIFWIFRPFAAIMYRRYERKETYYES